MVNKRKKRKAPRRAPPMSREMLLPTSAATARTVSLQNHMALVALRQGHGNVDLAAELLKTVYLTYFLSDAENLTATTDKFVAAEHALKSSILDSVTTGEWRLSNGLCPKIEAVLCAHDRLLASVPVHRIVAVKAKLSRILEAGDFPDMLARHVTKTEGGDT